MQRDRAAAKAGGERSRTVDYVRDDIAEGMMERFMVRIAVLSARSVSYVYGKCIHASGHQEVI
jgi:hypothetical protein